ncbi:MAG: phosphatase PAP2 family protein [Verrucomicrobiota bacterium]
MQSSFSRFALTLLLLAGTFAVFQFTDIDVWVQDHFYNFEKHRWFLDNQAPWPRLIFYTGSKIVLAIAGGGLVVWLLFPTRWRPRSLQRVELPWPSHRLWPMLLCLTIVPITIGAMKRRSDLSCPWSIDRYGGDRPHLRFFDALPPGYRPDCGKCFPAGHASGGFALFGLSLLSDSRRSRWIGLATGMTAGWLLGGYQMLKGAHFLSHTVVTMLIAWAFVELLSYLSNIWSNQSRRRRSRHSQRVEVRL